MSRELVDSGIEWIGKMPGKWEIRKLKHLTHIQTGNTPTKEKQNVYYSNEDGIKWIKADNLGNSIEISKTTEYLTTEGIKQGKLFSKNSIYVCCIASIGKVGFSTDEASCNQQINSLDFYNAYWKYGYYLTLAQENEYLLNTTGNVVKILNSERQGNIICPFPSLKEQEKIANYLDNKTSKIDQTIKDNKKEIKLLDEYKNSLITRTMNFGIKKDIKIVNTNIKLIPEIPKHWRIEKLNNISKKTISYGVVKLFDPDHKDGIKIIRCSDVKEGYIIENNIRTITKKLSNEYKRTILSEGDIIINVRGTLGGCSVVPKEMEGYNIAREVALISPHKEYNSKYIMYALLSNTFKEYLNYNLAGTIYLGINMNSLSKYLLAIPEYEEQNEIVGYLDNMCDKFDKIILYRKKIIEKLEEYKKSLIYEVVTGKKEV